MRKSFALNKHKGILKNCTKRTSKTQYVKTSEAFRKIYLRYQALYKVNNVTEFTTVTKLRIKIKNYFKLIDMRVHLN